MSKSSSDKEKEISEVMRKKMQKNVPKEIINQINALGRKEKIDDEKFIEVVKELPELKKRYAILPLLYYTNNNKMAEHILVNLLDHTPNNLKQKIIVSLAHRKNDKFKKKIVEYLEDENEEIKTMSIWALAYMGVKNNLFETIMKLYPKLTTDDARIPVIVALYHLNKNPNSKEMKYLKELFLTKYYDEKNDLLLLYEDSDYNRSTVMIADILWLAGIKIIKTHGNEYMNIYKHLMEEINLEKRL